MFTNLSLKGFTWKREPILWLALLVAAGNAVVGAVNGDLTWTQFWEGIVALVVGFVGRGEVSPIRGQ